MLVNTKIHLGTYLVRQVPPFLQTLLLQAAAGVGPIVTPPSAEERVVTRVVSILALEVAPSSIEVWVVLPPSSSWLVVGEVLTVLASPPLSTSSSAPSDGVAPVSPPASMLSV